MNRKLLYLSIIMSVLLTFTGMVVAKEELVFSDSFEDNTVGQSPKGWTLSHSHGGLVVDSSQVIIPHGELALQLNSTTSLYGEVYYDIPEIKQGKLVVDFMQPSSSRENINIEIKNGDNRLVGVFITGSGNVRPRDNGVQTADLIRLPNDQWHTFVIKWDVDEKTFHVSYMQGENEIAITSEGAGLDPAGIGLPGSRILFNVSPRDPEKEAFIDNVRVYNLGI